MILNNESAGQQPIGYGGNMGITPVCILGGDNLYNRRNDDNCLDEVIADNVADLRNETQGVATEVHRLGNELSNQFHMQSLANADRIHQQTININENMHRHEISMDKQFCDLGARVDRQFSDVRVEIKDTQRMTEVAALNARIDGLKNTQDIKDQAVQFQIKNEESFCLVRNLIREDGEKTRALITENKIEDLRAQLAGERRHIDRRETEIHITNTNQQTQNQLQAQLQQQSQAFANTLNMLGDQLNRQTNSIINLGTLAGVGQNASNANTKVNS